MGSVGTWRDFQLSEEDNRPSETGVKETTPAMLVQGPEHRSFVIAVSAFNKEGTSQPQSHNFFKKSFLLCYLPCKRLFM